MTVLPWPEIVVNTNTRFVPMVSGFAWYDPTGRGLTTSTGVTINEPCAMVSFSTTYIYLFDGDNLKVYNLSGVLLATYVADIVALYPDMGFTVDGRILQYNGSNIVQRGSYNGTPVGNALTIYRGKLQRYSQVPDGRYSLFAEYDAYEPSGDIVRCGFDTVNGKFVVVSEYRTLVFSYDGNYDFALIGKYNHQKAVGVAEGNVIFGGSGEPGKISDVFDYDGALQPQPDYDPWGGGASGSSPGNGPGMLHFWEEVGNVKIVSSIGSGGSVNLSSCGYTGYFGFGPSGSGVDCDVWRAWREGAWKGSVTFTLYISLNTVSSQLRIGRGTGVAGSVIAPSSITTNPVASAGGTCASPSGTIVKTLTVYENGTLTLT